MHIVNPETMRAADQYPIGEWSGSSSRIARPVESGDEISLVATRLLGSSKIVKNAINGWPITVLFFCLKVLTYRHGE